MRMPVSVSDAIFTNIFIYNRLLQISQNALCVFYKKSPILKCIGRGREGKSRHMFWLRYTAHVERKALSIHHGMPERELVF